MPASNDAAAFRTADWPVGGGESGALVRSFDWNATSLGPIGQWTPGLRSTVQLVLESPVAMVLMWGPDHTMIYNDGYALIAGARHPAALGGSVPKLWPEIWDWNRAILQAGFRGEVLTYRDQPMVVERSGQPEDVWFDLFYTPARDDAGAVGGVLCTVVETTHRVQAHQRAARDNDFLRGLFEQAPNFMTVLRGAEHRVELANAQYLRLVGNRDVVGRTVREALPEVAEQGFVELLNGVFQSGQPFVGNKVKIALQGANGGPMEERVLDFVYQPFRGADGGVEGIFVVGSDVTDRSIAEERLRVAQQAGGIGTFEWFPESGRLVVSDEYRRIWGFPPDVTLTDTMLLAQLDPADRKLAGVSRMHTMANPLEYAEYRIVHAQTGERRWIARRGEVVHASGRTPRRFVGVAFDITQRRQAEEALRELNETLEQRVADEVAQRSATEDALRQSQKMEAVGQLTGGIAHDFNNLLQGIVGSIELARKLIARGRAGEVDRFLNSAMASTNRAAALTHRLLAFSRRQPLDPKPVHANQLVASMEDLLRRSLGTGVQMEMVLAGGLWTTRCDTNQLENAVLNLAINARDAMPDGGKLTIETCNAHLDAAYAAQHREVAAGQYVCISVTDTGSGMSPDVVARAFDPFFTTKPLGQGTGLGLSMIYGFARQSEGSAKIYSEVGRGTTVKLYLPRWRGEAAPAADEASDETASVDNGDNGSTVLVVEDEAVVRDLVTEVLQELGYRAIEAVDGTAALKLLESGLHLDLLITDIGLPGLNGRQVADAARVTRPQLQVLFMTGYAENAALANGFLEPGMHMITKPFAMDALASRVSDMMSRARRADAGN